MSLLKKLTDFLQFILKTQIVIVGHVILKSFS